MRKWYLHSLKALESFEVLPLQAYRLAAHRFIKARRQRTSLLTAQQAAWTSYFFWFPLFPKFHRINMKWPKWMLHTQHITSQLRSPELRKPWTIMASMQFAHLPLSETLSLFLWIANKAALCSRGKHYVCLTRLSAMKTSLKRQTRTKGNQCLSEVQKCKRIVFQQKHFYRIKRIESIINYRTKGATLCGES